MTPMELFAALGSGALLAAAKFLWDIRNDSAAALRILTGEDEVEEDRGLVAEVGQLRDRLDRVEGIVSRHHQNDSDRT